MVMSRRTVLVAFVAMAPASAVASPCCGPISADGVRLREFLDNSGVDHLWLCDCAVDWKTGETIADYGSASANLHTHCSAFAASAAMRLGVYILRRREHTVSLLANAQMAWLSAPDGVAHGWQPVADVTTAQTRANQGDLVVASFQNPLPVEAGHIAIVRPSAISAERLLEDGPYVTQAGARNHISVALKYGFAGHKGAWLPGGGGAVRFFAHSVDWTAV
jgi:hypothetical protein